ALECSCTVAVFVYFFFSSRRRHTRFSRDWSSDVCSSDLTAPREGFNTETGEVTNGYLRYVVYIPYATAESTGLPLKPDVPGMPWIMDPGTHRAHIMINPAK